MTITDILQIAISALTLIGLVIGWYKIFRDPDVRADKNIALQQATCALKHQRIDSEFSEMKEDISLIKNNHLAHIEENIKTMAGDIIEIKTILKERASTQKQHD